MLNDIGNQKLPRFRAGLPLLEQVSGGVEYNRGHIDENGKLIGLPSQFKSNYTYDGYMELQQGCPDVCYDDIWSVGIKWPES